MTEEVLSMLLQEFAGEFSAMLDGFVDALVLNEVGLQQPPNM